MARSVKEIFQENFSGIDWEVNYYDDDDLTSITAEKDGGFCLVDGYEEDSVHEMWIEFTRFDFSDILEIQRRIDENEKNLIQEVKITGLENHKVKGTIYWRA